MPAAPLTLARAVSVLHEWCDPATAADWDRVGLVTGDPGQPVSRVMFAVDPLPPVIEEAVDGGADLLVVHHPLLLRGVSSVAATSAKGRAVHDLIRNGVALLSMHTNADAAHGGVNDALADAVGMSRQRRPIEPVPDGDIVRIVVHITAEHTDALIAAMSAAGAGAIGRYDFCAYWVDGIGQFRPLPGADPHIGAVGALERVAERRVEMVLPRSRMDAVVHAMRGAHPYEEPAFTVMDTIPAPGGRGLGRIGALAEVTLHDLALRLADALPPTAHGVRVAGDPQLVVHKAAVCGGAGDSLLSRVRAAGADVYITSDLRHHPATDARAEGGPALIDIAHWAGEWLWLREAADRLVAGAARAGARVTAWVSDINTDPWTFRVDGARR